MTLKIGDLNFIIKLTHFCLYYCLELCLQRTLLSFLSLFRQLFHSFFPLRSFPFLFPAHPIKQIGNLVQRWILSIPEKTARSQIDFLGYCVNCLT